MLKVTEERIDSHNVIKMHDMKPLQVGELLGGIGHIVMRTASNTKFEVMDLTTPGVYQCWTGEPNLDVRLLSENEYVAIKVFNKEA